MKKSLLSIIIMLSVFSSSIVLFNSCGSDEEDLPVVSYYRHYVPNQLVPDYQIFYQVTAEGSATVSDHGVCWSTNESPTISNDFISGGAGTTSVTDVFIPISSLPTGRVYLRAYATNSYGTAYSNTFSFDVN